MYHDPDFVAFRLVDYTSKQGLYSALSREELYWAFAAIKPRKNMKASKIVKVAEDRGFIFPDGETDYRVDFQMLYRFRAKITERMLKKTMVHKD